MVIRSWPLRIIRNLIIIKPDLNEEGGTFKHLQCIQMIINLLVMEPKPQTVAIN